MALVAQIFLSVRFEEVCKDYKGKLSAVFSASATEEHLTTYFVAALWYALRYLFVNFTIQKYRIWKGVAIRGNTWLLRSVILEGKRGKTGSSTKVCPWLHLILRMGKGTCRIHAENTRAFSVYACDVWCWRRKNSQIIVIVLWWWSTGRRCCNCLSSTCSPLQTQSSASFICCLSGMASKYPFAPCSKAWLTREGAE